MNGGDVYPGEMNDPHDLDDATAEALLSGATHSAPSQLADFVGDVRVAYTSTPAASAEIAALILFLASDRAGWMTGETIPIDGGRHLTCAR